ncbi:MAG: 1,4-dihydroxy-2-naphthoate polyprenyltransferase [Streptococcus hyovaginalis]|nr:1,4-dihydroxy-2-naphthoate polyprenyltransferase [Streptococcus hyovaginalis]MDY4510994.1 1,4-dihydroxy-2-naphthoate polyprenyltransferase [Streptococcus hyovaginalis]
MRIITLSTKTKGVTLPIFLEFIELRTKVASFFPMVIGVLWAIYHYQRFNPLNTLLFVLAVLSFDMCTTAINNTMDFKKAVDLTYQKEENVIGKHGLDYDHMVKIVFSLLGIAILFSLFLVFRTDFLLLPIGALCFLIGIFYTFGPMPLSRLPLGEVFSGITMGFGIFFLSIYVQDPNLLLNSQWIGGVATIYWSWQETLNSFFLSLPLIALIANIMLANNLCDLEQDIKNHRHTLVYYIGKKAGVTLYTLLSFLPWLVWFGAIFLGQLPIFGLLGVIIFPKYLNHLKQFQKEQIKSKTFVTSIKNFVLFSIMYLVTLLITLLISLI